MSEEEEEVEGLPPSFKVFGNYNSPYSVKVRAYFRFKKLRHEWVPRCFETEEEFQRLARLAIVPLVVDPDGNAMQDSTPIIEKVEQQYPRPSVHPQCTALKFLSELIEEFSDEWANKFMFHYRWVSSLFLLHCKFTICSRT